MSHTAIVTGGTRGIGAAISVALSEDGHKVAATYAGNDEAAEAFKTQTGISVYRFDVADFDQCAESVSRIETDLGPVSILVNNAGIPPSMRPLPFRQTTPDDWAPFLDVNIVGVLNCTRAVIDGMCERGHGRVITISSGSGTHGQNIGVSLYGAGKGGAISFMRHLALETARDGVTANTLALGLMEREDGPSEIAEKMARMIPVGRTGTPDDIGYAVTFLASDEAAWITGQTIAVNGGSTTS